jgi:hypothetical protein
LQNRSLLLFPAMPLLLAYTDRCGCDVAAKVRGASVDEGTMASGTDVSALPISSSWNNVLKWPRSFPGFSGRWRLQHKNLK